MGWKTMLIHLPRNSIPYACRFVRFTGPVNVSYSSGKLLATLSGFRGGASKISDQASKYEL